MTEVLKLYREDVALRAVEVDETKAEGGVGTVAVVVVAVVVGPLRCTRLCIEVKWWQRGCVSKQGGRAVETACVEWKFKEQPVLLTFLKSREEKA